MTSAFALERMARRFVLLIGCLSGLAGAASGDSVNSTERRVTRLAEGVYTIRHPDPTDDFPDGNTTVVIGADGVLVVDTCYLPSSARADIGLIRSWTDKPVRYVVNTHWHYDHNGGNSAYVEAYPSVVVIAHAETRAMMDARTPSYIARYVAEDSVFGNDRARLRAMLESGRDPEGKPITAEVRATTARNLARKERAQREFREFVYRPPAITIERELVVDLGGRQVQLKFLGRGNTGGDLVVYLPQERVVIAGDLIDHPVPYAFGGYPSEWIRTLQRLGELDADVIVPGHGDVMHDKMHLRSVIALLSSVTAQVNEIVDRLGSAATLEIVARSVDVTRFRKEMAGDDSDNLEFFDASIASLVRIVYAEVKAR